MSVKCDVCITISVRLVLELKKQSILALCKALPSFIYLPTYREMFVY